MPHTATEITVETSNTLRLLSAHKPRKCPAAFNSRRHALPSITIVSSSNGIVSNRNAGAMAAPADAVPIDESTAGITHHQGSGRMGAITFSRGISIENGLSICFPFIRSGHDVWAKLTVAGDLVIGLSDASLRVITPHRADKPSA